MLPTLLLLHPLLLLHLLLLLPLLPPVHPATPGVLLVGGLGSQTSAEFWSPSTSCTLPALPRAMYGHTLSVDPLQGKAYACHLTSCAQLSATGWQEAVELVHPRQGHTATTTARGILLMGGSLSPTTTELVAASEGVSREGFTLSPGRQGHCTVQVDPATVVVTGGRDTQALVTRYSGLEGEEVVARDLANLLTGRQDHACGSYMVGEVQVLMVAGGFDGSAYLASSEVMEGEVWRAVADLPSARWGVLLLLLLQMGGAGGGGGGGAAGDWGGPGPGGGGGGGLGPGGGGVGGGGGGGGGEVVPRRHRGHPRGCGRLLCINLNTDPLFHSRVVSTFPQLTFKDHMD